MRQAIFLCVALAAACSGDNAEPGDDAPTDALAISPAITTIAEGTSQLITIRLTDVPRGDIAIDLSSSGLDLGVDQIVLGPTALEQQVMISALDDNDVQDSATKLLAVGPNIQGASADVAILDDDTQLIEVSPPTMTFTQGTSAPLQVRLRFQPSAPTTVTLSSNNPEVAVPTTLSFTAANYHTYQVATVTSLGEDNTADELATLTIANAEAPAPTAVPVTVSETMTITRYGWPAPFANSQPIANGSVIAFKVTVDTTTLDKFGMIANEAGGDFKMALYTDAGNAPGTLVTQLDSRTTVTAPGLYEVDVGNVALPSGSYWIAVRAAPSVSFRSAGATSTASYCSRNLAITNLDAAWPSSFGAATCGSTSALNVHVVTQI